MIGKNRKYIRAAVVVSAALIIAAALTACAPGAGSGAESGDPEANYLPAADPLIRASAFHRVRWSEGGWKYAARHSDYKEGFTVSSVQYLSATHFEDADALADYMAGGEALYDFAGIFAQYDEEFFQDNRLVLVYVEDGSGSAQFALGGAALGGEGSMTIDVNRISPELGTADMLAGFLALECPRNAAPEVSKFIARYALPSADHPFDAEGGQGGQSGALGSEQAGPGPD
ncbi:MAG: hypothetical protein LBL37_09575 [Gracilibacteraceae bacterium]|nr:hypothetical protein [Gracilibacteraceae bacterium]